MRLKCWQRRLSWPNVPNIVPSSWRSAGAGASCRAVCRCTSMPHECRKAHGRGPVVNRTIFKQVTRTLIALPATHGGVVAHRHSRTCAKCAGASSGVLAPALCVGSGSPQGKPSSSQRPASTQSEPRSRCFVRQPVSLSPRRPVRRLDRRREAPLAASTPAAEARRRSGSRTSHELVSPHRRHDAPV